MEKIKEYIKNNAYGINDGRHIFELKKYEDVRLLTEKELEERKLIVEKQFNVTLPEDYCEFLSYSYGFGFENNNYIVNLEGKERYGTEDYTLTFDDLMVDDNPDFLEKFENHIVVAKYNEGSGYVLYLNESKKYLAINYIEDIPYSVIELNNIWEVAIFLIDENKGFDEEQNEILNRTKEVNDLIECVSGNKNNNIETNKKIENNNIETNKKIENNSKNNEKSTIEKIIKKIKDFLMN